MKRVAWACLQTVVTVLVVLAAWLVAFVVLGVIIRIKDHWWFWPGAIGLAVVGTWIADGPDATSLRAQDRVDLHPDVRVRRP